MTHRTNRFRPHFSLAMMAALLLTPSCAMAQQGAVYVARSDNTLLFPTAADFFGANSSAMAAALGSDFLEESNNLSDLDSASTALTNLGGTAAGQAMFTAADADAQATLLTDDATAQQTLIGATRGNYIAGDTQKYRQKQTQMAKGEAGQLNILSMGDSLGPAVLKYWIGRWVRGFSEYTTGDEYYGRGGVGGSYFLRPGYSESIFTARYAVMETAGAEFESSESSLADYISTEWSGDSPSTGDVVEIDTDLTTTVWYELTSEDGDEVDDWTVRVTQYQYSAENPGGPSWDIAAGGNITFDLASAGAPPWEKLSVYYEETAGTGTFDIHLDDDDDVFAKDGATVDTNGTAGDLGIATRTQSIDKKRLRLVGVSGTSRISPAPFFEMTSTPAPNIYNLSTGSWDAALASGYDDDYMTALLADIAPDLITIQTADILSDYQVFIPKLETWLAGLSYTPGVVIIGSGPHSSHSDATMQATADYLREQCIENGWGFIDTFGIAQSTAILTANGLIGDGIHMDEDFYAGLSETGWTLLGLDNPLFGADTRRTVFYDNSPIPALSGYSIELGKNPTDTTLRLSATGGVNTAQLDLYRELDIRTLGGTRVGRFGTNHANDSVRSFWREGFGFVSAGATDATGAACVFVSTGSPEGVQTGNVGSWCLDTNGGGFYYKASGTGNTGWVRLLETDDLATSITDTDASAATPGAVYGELAAQIGGISVTLADDGDDTGTATFQVQDANGNDLSGTFLIDVWIDSDAVILPGAAVGTVTITSGVQIETITTNVRWKVATNSSGQAIFSVEPSALPDDVYAVGAVGGYTVSDNITIADAP